MTTGEKIFNDNKFHNFMDCKYTATTALAIAILQISFIDKFIKKPQILLLNTVNQTFILLLYTWDSSLYNFDK